MATDVTPTTELVTIEEMNDTAYMKQVSVRTRAVEVSARALRDGRGWNKYRAGALEDIIALSEYILTGILPEWVEADSNGR